MEIEDAYKWLFHATQGGEHAVTDDSGPRAWMDGEWRTLTGGRAEPLVQKLTPDGRLVRINLRPYKASGGDKEMILSVFVASARQFRARRQVFVREWQGLGDLLKRRAISRITYSDWARLDREAKPRGYPAWGHSDTYERIYRPAYRVVLSTLTVNGR